MDYAVDTSIDKNNLDNEWLKQADLYDEYGKKAASAYKDWGDLKITFKQKKAEVEQKLRGGELTVSFKLTENSISAYLEAYPELVALEREVVKAKYEYDIWNSAVFAMEHKKRALEFLTKLEFSQYSHDDSAYQAYREKLNQ